VQRLGIGSLGRPRTLARALGFIRFLRREAIDVLQVYFPDSTCFGIPAAWLAGTPQRIRTSNNLGHASTRMSRLLGRFLNRFTSLTVTNCQAARQALLAHEKPRPERVLVLENGVDLERFMAIPRLTRRDSLGPARIGAIANLRPVKGLDVLLEAAAILRHAHPQACYQIAGEGELRPALLQAAKDHGLGQRFRLLGSVTEIPAYLAGLDIAVSCSRAEGMSNAVLEYMAGGRAIVATCVGATPDLIEDGVHGLLVPPGDARRLAAAMDLLMRDPALACRLGEAARQRAQECYSRGAMVRRFEDFYESLVRRSL
jgi:glycosyltransferase involved in cell wall biosynthesis